MVDGSKCVQCGKCCQLKTWNPYFGVYRLIGENCPHLGEDNRCDCYDVRLIVSDLCITLQECANRGLMPTDCPCMEKGYKSKVDYEGVYDEQIRVSKRP